MITTTEAREEWKLEKDEWMKGENKEEVTETKNNTDEKCWVRDKEREVEVRNTSMHENKERLKKNERTTKAHYKRPICVSLAVSHPQKHTLWECRRFVFGGAEAKSCDFSPHSARQETLQQTPPEKKETCQKTLQETFNGVCFHRRGNMCKVVTFHQPKINRRKQHFSASYFFHLAAQHNAGRTVFLNGIDNDFVIP